MHLYTLVLQACSMIGNVQTFTRERNVQWTDTTNERNVQGKNIKSKRNIQLTINYCTSVH